MVAGGGSWKHRAAPAESACVCVRVFSAQADTSACVYYPGNLNIHVLILHTNEQPRTIEEKCSYTGSRREMRFFRQRQTLVIILQQHKVNSHRTTTGKQPLSQCGETVNRCQTTQQSLLCLFTKSLVFVTVKLLPFPSSLQSLLLLF